MDHELYMSRALELARQAFALGEVPVGCVIVWEDGTIVGEGYNRRETDADALGHAELMAIRQANEKLGGWRLHRARLYVTVEPCPMCAGAILNARIAEVHYGVRDPSLGACGSVVNLFEENFEGLKGPRLYRGPLEEDCGKLMREFFAKRRQEKSLI